MIYLLSFCPKIEHKIKNLFDEDRNNPRVNGEVLAVERLGKETDRYIKIGGSETIVVQTDRDNPAIMPDYVPIYINGELCHLFDRDGEAIPKVHRHHLTLNESHEQQYQHRIGNQAE
ncbi:MAG: TOBE domain-containing protein [Nostoc sp.]|uniref:TOBE domain-containing protein n=1 Tax=Nostoc sp. TaxID=1180 RepID=UPI002FF5CAE0